MPREWDNADGPLESDLDRFGDDDDADEPDAFCGECGGAVHHFVDRCPHCGAWITPRHSRGRSSIVIAVVLVALMALLAIRWAR
ncbi:MAG: hypothetical protein KDA32_09870 [Phycisphaerales bacterium]|nr:hypothetical protein [Phycisphaerales bacterium]